MSTPTAAPAAAPSSITPQRGFEILVGKLKDAGPDGQKRIAAHIRSVTGRPMALPVYHNDPAINDADKLRCYSICVRAIMEKNWSLLQGQVANGERRVDPAEEAASPAASPAPAPVVERNTPVKHEAPAPAAAPPTPKVVLVDDASRMSPVARAILDEISPFLPKGQAVDEDAVNRIAEAKLKANGEEFKKLCEEVFKHSMSNGGFPADRVGKLIHEKLKGNVVRIEFQSIGGEFKPLTGLVHPQVTQLATWLRAGIPVWAWGAAGAGKTTMHEQIATLLDLNPYLFSVDPTMTVGKIVGFRAAGNGEFFEGHIYKSFKEGGLQGADEKDTGDAGVMASLNAVLSNEFYTFPNGERVRKHENFRYIAYANTRGMGAVAGYSARNKLDAATLDRFAVIEVKYDPGLETAIACGVGKPADPWKPGPAADLPTQQKFVEWVQKLREFAGNSILISPRASINGCKALRHGIPMPEVVEALVFKLVSEDSRKRCIDSCGLPYKA